MATNYSRGRAKEYATIYELQDEGYTCMRAASSKGMFDVLAWKEGEGPRCIQCKRESTPTNKTYPAERRQMFNTPVPLHATRELWVWNNAMRAWRLKLVITSETEYSAIKALKAKTKPRGRPINNSPEPKKIRRPKSLLVPSPDHVSSL
jgi:hypothetical protein